MSTTVTFRTDADLKNQATLVFDSMGLSLSTALNLFMRQAVLKQRFPCSLDSDISVNASATYPEGFFNLFGAGNGLGFDNEPDDIPAENKELEL